MGGRGECVAAVARREREGALDRAAVALVLERLRSLREGWTDVEPTDTIRRTAVRLVRSHPLRAADGLQLAAALAATEGDPRSLPLVTLDERLRDAAEREGLRVEP